MNEIFIVFSLITGISLGFLMDRFLLKKQFRTKVLEAEERGRSIIREAENTGGNIKKNKILEGKEKFIKLRNEFEEYANKRKNQMDSDGNRLRQKESQLSKQIKENENTNAELKSIKDNLASQISLVKKRREELDKLKDHKVIMLEKISNLAADDAKIQLMETLQDEARTEASAYIKEIIEEAKLTATKQAKKIVLATIQRTATEHAIENCISVFNIENDNVKGKVIGREGRNIRALESATGVEIIIDDTPEAIIISGFDPVRREIAKLSLHRLVQDGRIHPARIEETVEKTKNNIEEEIVEIGERAIIDLGIHGLHPELIKMVGRMRFRSSYGQNLLHHSKEVARLCATMAAELGLNAKQAKRAGLLHDIGKVWPDDCETPHAILGMKIAEKHKEHKHVCNAIGAHHDEIEMTTMISPIVQACDAISGSRPGARREILDSYIQRLKDLESLAVDFDGVNKCYAIQAGRELRVIVDADQVSDHEAGNLSFNISQKIEKDMQYPGQIKVTVIRETRAVHFAR